MQRMITFILSSLAFHPLPVWPVYVTEAYLHEVSTCCMSLVRLGYTVKNSVLLVHFKFDTQRCVNT